MSKSPKIHRPATRSDYEKLHKELTGRGFVALEALKPGSVHSISIGSVDAATLGADTMAGCIGKGAWSNGPLSRVAWSFDERTNTVTPVKDAKGKPLGLGYVWWGPNNSIPSTIPPLALALPYTSAPLRYIADLTAGLGPRLMYHFADGTFMLYKYAGEVLRQRVLDLGGDLKDPDNPGDLKDPKDPTPLGDLVAPEESLALRRARRDLAEWERTWYGEDVCDNPDAPKEQQTFTHVPGAKEFLDENNLDLHLSQCEQDDVMLDIYFPTVGFHNRGRKGVWRPVISRVDMMPAHSCRLEKMNEHRFINHVYVSDQWRTIGASGTQVVEPDADQHIAMYPAAMPQRRLADLRQLVKDNQNTPAGRRPMWAFCPTFYPSGQKMYYPQPAWWSIFTSKAFDFSSTILYDKAKQRENSTSWGKIIYISLDYLESCFAKEGIMGDQKKQEEFIDELDRSVEEFLTHRENQGKMMRQFMWQGQGDKEHRSVEIVDVAGTKNDEVTAGKNELEISTSPIFLALQVDPRLVGVPMVAASNGGTALREMHLLKQQQLSVKQRLYLQFLNTVPTFNEWDDHAEFCIVQQTLTTLDRSKTGTEETVSGEQS